MTRRVVVGSTGSERSEAALHWALGYAADHDLPVEIVGVIEHPRVRAGLVDPAAGRVTIGEQLEEAQAAAGFSHPSVRTSVRLADGDPVHVLADAAPLDSLLVIGARPLHGIGPAIHAPVSVRVAAATRSTVALIPPGSGGPAEQGRRGIAVGVDGSEASLEAVAFAAQEADRVGEPLVAVHAWQLPGAWADSAPHERLVIDAIEEDENLLLAESVAGLGARFPDLEIQHSLVRRSTVEALSEAAGRARMLVVGSHGRGAFLRLLLGSVSHSMALSVPGPLVVVRHHPHPR